ncbi:hypothetical protein GCM10022631_18710 [Deinococcus rubellus]
MSGPEVPAAWAGLANMERVSRAGAAVTRTFRMLFMSFLLGVFQGLYLGSGRVAAGFLLKLLKRRRGTVPLS